MAATLAERDRPGAGLKEPLVTDAATQRLHARQQWDALDGLRAIAVLAVVVYHGSVGWAVNGYVGVDIFFVVSGFLISTLSSVSSSEHEASTCHVSGCGGHGGSCPHSCSSCWCRSPEV